MIVRSFGSRKKKENSIEMGNVICWQRTFIIFGLVSMDNVSLTKIICHRNFGHEFVFTHSKDYLYY